MRLSRQTNSWAAYSIECHIAALFRKFLHTDELAAKGISRFHRQQRRELFTGERTAGNCYRLDARRPVDMIPEEVNAVQDRVVGQFKHRPSMQPYAQRVGVREAHA